MEVSQTAADSVCLCGLFQVASPSCFWVQGPHHLLHIEDQTAGLLPLTPWNHHGGSRATPPPELTPAAQAPAPQGPHLRSWAQGRGWDPPPHLDTTSGGCLRDASPTCLPPCQFPGPSASSFQQNSRPPTYQTSIAPAPLRRRQHPCFVSPAAWRRAAPLWQLHPLPSSRPQSLFFSLNVQVNFY